MEIQSIILFMGLSALAVVTKYQSPINAYRLFKIIPIFFLIIWIIESDNFQNDFYTKTILVGLCFSVMGDFLLLYPSQFKSGLFSFLIGHVWYILGFISTGWKFPFLPTSLILILSIGMILKIYPNVGKLRIPVLIYISIIACMGISALGRLEAFQSTPSMLGALGATLFMISDGVLGWNKFKKPFPLAEAIILTTYYLGQWMIALSTLY